MSTKIKVALLALLVGANIAFMAPTVLTHHALAQDTISDACTAWQQAKGLCSTTLRPMILTIINYFLMFLGLITTGILIYGGFMYITSAGNDENVGKAKKLIIYAGIGIIVVLLAAVLVQSILGAGTAGLAPSQQ